MNEYINYCEKCKKFELIKDYDNNYRHFRCIKTNAIIYSRQCISIDNIRKSNENDSENYDNHINLIMYKVETNIDEENSYYNDFSDFKIAFMKTGYNFYKYKDDIKNIIVENIDKSNQEITDILNKKLKIEREKISDFYLYFNTKEKTKKDKVQFFIDGKRQKGWKMNTKDNIEFYTFKSFLLKSNKDIFKQHPYLSDIGYPTDVISNLIDNPALEILLKANIIKSLNIYIGPYINKNGTNPSEILKLDKDKIKILRAYADDQYEDVFDYSYKHYIDRIISHLQENNKITFEKFNDLYNNYKEFITNYHFNYQRHSSVRLGVSGFLNLLELCVNENYDTSKLIKYLGEDCRELQGIIRFNDALMYLKDYVISCKDLNLKYEKYPRSLRLEHDKITYMKLLKADEINNQKIKDRIELLNKYVYEDKEFGYSIILPKEAMDLKREGNALSHCVGSYVDRFARGDSNIFFMRKINEIDKPLVTVELNKHLFLIQARGYSNRNLDEKEEKFLNKWLDHIKKISNNNDQVSA